MLSYREELIGLIAQMLPEDGTLEVIPGLILGRSSQPTDRLHSLFKPAFCVIAQGSKQVLLGEEVLRYDPGHYLISTVDLPIVSHVVEASEKHPYYSVRLNLDAAIVASVMVESEVRTRKGDANLKAMAVSSLDANLLDAVVRLVKLISTPEEIQILAPLIIRETVYRLLRGEQGARLNHLLTSGGDTQRISRAIGHLRENLDHPLRIDNMARELGMSVSGFHHHFKSVTAMSPLQFQKQMRLQEARRLMLGEDLDAASAGFRVGYDDPSHFSREYKKHFGAPPHTDIASIRRTLETAR
jgi:AraC-like DNA-binding protein